MSLPHAPTKNGEPTPVQALAVCAIKVGEQGDLVWAEGNRFLVYGGAPHQSGQPVGPYECCTSAPSTERVFHVVVDSVNSRLNRVENCCYLKTQVFQIQPSYAQGFRDS